ncbi:MAG: UDP-glucose 4-epimerase GalE, partial [Bacteroidota bacterium]|nr:UDP-glucose 4-epimerase GalE [Bacteroidota bacterium]
GISVLEAIRAFEKVTGEKLPYKIGPRREGDVAAVYSDTRRSEQLLNWKAIHDIETMMASAFAWEQQLMSGSVNKKLAP